MQIAIGSTREPKIEAMKEAWQVFGSRGVSVPSRIADPVIDRGIELGIIIDRFSEQKDIRSKQGAWGVLTQDVLTRKHSFVIALIAAFAPFYNCDAYQQ